MTEQADRDHSPDDHRPDDHRTQSVEDQFRSLMEGLRTTLPGVQVLFAFLLILPFRPEFGDLRQSHRSAYYLAFATSALGSVLLIAPSVHQRMRAPISGIRRRTKRHVLVAARIAIVGTVCLAIAIGSVTFLVTGLVFGSSEALGAVTIITVTIAWAWFYLPLVDFARDSPDDS